MGDGERLSLDALGGSLAGDGFVWLQCGVRGHVGCHQVRHQSG